MTNKTSPITCFTVPELKAQHQTPTGSLSECLVTHSGTDFEVFKYPCRIDAFIMGVCTAGEGVSLSNFREFHLKRNDLFIVSPGQIIQMKSDHDFKAHVIAISSDFMTQILIDTKHLTKLLLNFSESPCMAISDDECTALRSMIHLLETELNGVQTQLTPDIGRSLIAAVIYKIGDIICRYPQKQDKSKTQADGYFKNFMALLGDNYKKERTVGFYAQQMCVTPKYLTTLIKRTSGRSVSEWIDHFVILESKSLLKYSSMSIQEISYYLNFPNQSFFGSYFKRITGVSPSHYKIQ